MDGKQQHRIDGPADRDLSKQSAVYRELRQLSSSPMFDLDEMVEKVTTHPAVARRLLRVANASSQGLSRRISSVRHAIIMLGAAGMKTFSQADDDVDAASTSLESDRDIRIDPKSSPPPSMPQPTAARETVRET